MISVSLKIFVQDMESPYELYLPDNEKYSFHYGFGHESWGYHKLKFRVKFWSMDLETVRQMRKFMEKIYSQSLDDSSIRMISFEFNNNIDGSKEIFSFNQQEIANLNMTQIIDAEHKTTFVIAFNILNQENKI